MRSSSSTTSTRSISSAWAPRSTVTRASSSGRTCTSRRQLDADTLRVRHYERGVGLTRACGTGAVACAAAAIATRGGRSPVTVHVPGGVLDVAWQPGEHAFLTGPAETDSRAHARAVSARAGLAYADARGPHLFRRQRSNRLPTAATCARPRPDELIPAPPGTLPAMLPGRAPAPVDERGAAARTNGACGALAGGLHATLAARVSRAPGRARLAALRLHLRVRPQRRTLRRGDADGCGRRLVAAHVRGGRARSARCRRRARDPQNGVLAQLARLFARIRVFHGAKRLLGARRSGASRLAEMQRALHRLHLGARARRGHSLAANARRGRSDRRRAGAYRPRTSRARAGRHRLLRARLRGRAAAAHDDDRANDRTHPCEHVRGHDQPQYQRQPAEIAGDVDRRRARCRSRQPQFVSAGDRTPRTTGRSATISTTCSEACARQRTRGCACRSTCSRTRASPTTPANSTAMDAFLERVPVAMIQTRTLNIDPARYFAAVGRPDGAPLGMREALRRIEAHGVRVGNFTHAAAPTGRLRVSTLPSLLATNTVVARSDEQSGRHDAVKTRAECGRARRVRRSFRTRNRESRCRYR